MFAPSLIGYLSCSITLRSLAPPKLFDYKERDFTGRTPRSIRRLISASP